MLLMMSWLSLWTELLTTSPAKRQFQEKYGDFHTKYENKEFTKADLNDKTIFNMDEVSDYIDSHNGLFVYTPKLKKLVETGIGIVNEHSDVKLKLTNDFGRANAIINLIHSAQTYEVDWRSMHHEDRIQVSLLNTTKKIYVS